jgi:hypothetical protein
VERPLKIEHEKLKGYLIYTYGFQVSSFHLYYCISCSSCGTPINNDFYSYALRIIFEINWEYNTEWNVCVYVSVCVCVCVCIYIYIYIYIYLTVVYCCQLLTRTLWQLSFKQKMLNTWNGVQTFKCTPSTLVNVNTEWRQAEETRFESWFMWSLWRTQWIWNRRHNTHYSFKRLPMF